VDGCRDAATLYPGGDYEGQKNIFAAQNELTCPLN